MDNLEQPKIDKKEIQKRANEAAQKAYLDEIGRYYTEYDSPYKKMIKEELNKQKFKYNMKLPNILEKIKNTLSEEIDRIGNSVIANSYIPMISKMFVDLEDKEPTMSWFLKEVISELNPERDTFEDFSLECEQNPRHDWLNCTLSTPESEYEFTLHKKTFYGKDKAEQEAKHNGKAYNLLGFPSNKHKTGYGSNMTIYKDDVKIEMPFTPNILQDKVLAIFLRLLLNDGLLILDCKDFDDDMFPEQEHCEC